MQESFDIYYKQNLLNKLFLTVFVVDDKLLNKKSVFLVCEGVDTISQIYLNDVLVGTTDNMFVRYKFDIKSLLTSNENKIKIVFESAISYANRKHDEQVTKKYVIPQVNIPGNQQSHIKVDK